MELNDNSKESREKEREPRWHIIIAALIFLIIFSFFASISHRLIIWKSDFLANVLPKVLIDLTNSERFLFSLNQLEVNPLLQEAARRKAEDMAKNSYFAHISPSGVTPWYWFDTVSYNFRYAGENLAINFSDSNDVVKAWMDSPGHRANILSNHFTEIGIATAKGSYQGRETTFVVQMFGRPTFETVAQVAQAQSTGKGKVESVLALKEGNLEKFIAVERPSFDRASPAEIAMVGKISYSKLWEKVLSSPSLMLGAVYTVLGSVVIFLMFLALAVEIRKHHYLHIIYGTGLLFLILVLYMVSSVAVGGVDILGYLAWRNM